MLEQWAKIVLGFELKEGNFKNIKEVTEKKRNQS